jgi:predicted cupin superfamily sugar epimerase
VTAADIITALRMQPHPEGGHYVETFRAKAHRDGRATSTAIYFLLRAGERSAWHRVDADEIWLWHAGAPLNLSLKPEGRPEQRLVLGMELTGGARPQAVVPAHTWQAAESQGAWTLVSCVVAPGFEFSGFEMSNRRGLPE